MWIPNFKLYNSEHRFDFPVACETKIDGEFVHWNRQHLLNKHLTRKSTISKLPPMEAYGELFYGEGKEYYSEILTHQGNNNEVMLFDTGEYGREPYIFRRKLLESLAPEFNLVPMHQANTLEEIHSHFNNATQNGYEGIVIKPFASLTDKSWVKMKREFTCTLLIKGLRKGKSIPAVTVGTINHIYGSCSLNGWDIVTKMLREEQKRKGGEWITGEDKEQYFVNSEIKLEIKHNGIIMPNQKLRNPRVKRIRAMETEVSELWYENTQQNELSNQEK